MYCHVILQTREQIKWKIIYVKCDLGFRILNAYFDTFVIGFCRWFARVPSCYLSLEKCLNRISFTGAFLEQGVLSIFLNYCKFANGMDLNLVFRRWCIVAKIMKKIMHYQLVHALGSHNPLSDSQLAFFISVQQEVLVIS